MMVPAADNPLEENLINETNEKESDFLSVLPVRSQSISSSVSSETTPGWRASESCRSISGYIENGSFSTVASFENSLLRFHDEQDGASSMNNVFTYQELTQASSELENRISVTVDRPEKVLATLDTFITFRVVTKGNVPSFSELDHQVRRRYSDFAWLRQRLESQFPFYLLPALPEKHSVYSLDRFDPEFIKFRCMGLHLFLNWLIKQISVVDNADLRSFLCISDPDEWSSYRKTKSPGPSPSNLQLSALAQKCLVGDGHDSAFHTHNEYCLKLGQTLSALDKMALKLMKTEQECCKDMDAFQIVLNYWGESESSQQLKSAAAATASAVKTNRECLEATTQRFEPQFIAPVHQFSLYTDSVRNVLRKRDSIEIEHKNATDSVQKKQAEYDLMLRSTRPSDINVQRQSSNASVRSNKDIEGKLNKLDLTIKELTRKVDKCNLALQNANLEMNSELTRWHRMKDDELKQLLASLARQRVEMHKKCLAVWEEALNAATADKP